MKESLWRLARNISSALMSSTSSKTRAPELWPARPKNRRTDRPQIQKQIELKKDTWDLKAFDLDISFRNYTWWLNWTCFFGSRDFGQQGFNGVGAKLSRPSSSPAVGMQHSGVPAAMDILQTCDLCKTWQNTLREWKLCCLQPWSCYGHNPVVLHFTFVLLGWNRGIWRCRDMLP